MTQLTLAPSDTVSLVDEVALVAGDPVDFEEEAFPPPTAVIVLVKLEGFKKSLRSENLLKAELRLELEVCLDVLAAGGGGGGGCCTETETGGPLEGASRLTRTDDGEEVTEPAVIPMILGDLVIWLLTLVLEDESLREGVLLEKMLDLKEVLRKQDDSDDGGEEDEVSGSESEA